MLSLFLLFLLLLISLALGGRILNIIRLAPEPNEQISLENCLFSIGLGLAAIAYGVYLIGLLGFLYKSVLWGLLLVLAIFLAKDLPAYLKVIWEGLGNLKQIFKLERKNSFIVIISGLLALHIVFNLIGALAPEIIFDAIWYHLALPKIYLQNHRIFFLPYVDYAAFPRITEMLYTFSLALRSDILAKLLHFSLGILVILGIYSLSRKFFSVEVSLVASAIFYGMSNVNMLSATAYVDLALTFYEFLAVYALVNWFYGRNLRWLLLSGVLTGVALGIKHQAILLLGVLVICLILEFSLRRKSVFELLKNLAIFCAAALIIVGPWYIDSYLRTGNPVYPLFNTLFGTGKSFEKAMFASTGKKSWFYDHSPWEYFTLLWNFTMGRYEGWLSPLILFFLPLVLFIKKRPQIFKLSLLFGLLFYSAYFVAVPLYTVRYFLPVVPIVSIACAYIWQEISQLDQVLKKIITGVIVLTLLLNLGVLAFKNVPAIPVVFGRESRERYLTKTLGWYGVNQFIEGKVPKPVKVLVSGAPLFYYFNFNYVYGSGPEAKSYREKAIKLKKEGFTHLLLLVGSIDGPEVAKYFRLVYSKDMPASARSNAARSARLYEVLQNQK